MSVNSHTKPHLRHNDNTTTVRLMKTAEKSIIIIIIRPKTFPCKNRMAETKSPYMSLSLSGLYSHIHPTANSP